MLGEEAGEMLKGRGACDIVRRWDVGCWKEKGGAVWFDPARGGGG
jgi:hypothetical protein